MSLINVKRCKIQRKWELDLAQINALETAISTRCLSTNVPHVKYALLLFIDSNIQEICFGLVIYIPRDKTVKARYEFKINGICQYQTTEVDFFHGKRRSVRLGTLNDFVRPENNNFPDGSVTFECIATIRSENTVKKSFGEDRLVRHLHSKNFKNFGILPLDGSEIRVDKCVLSLHSSKFEEMFDDQESIEKLELNNSCQCISTVVKYCYDQDIEETIMKFEKIKMKELVMFTKCFEMRGLSDTVTDILIKNVNVGNLLKIVEIADYSDLKKVSEFCICFLMNFAGKDEPIANFDMIPEAMIIEVAKRLMTCTLV